MKIFLAGATGVIGRRLVPFLAEAGYEVTGMTNDATKTNLLNSLGARPVIVDVFDREGLFATLRSEQYGALIHELTSLRTADYAANNRIRIEGTRNLIDAALAAGIRRVVAQSYCLYAPGEGWAQEDDPLDIESGAYGGSIEGIQALEEAVGEAPEGVVLRYGTLYGPGTWFARNGAIAEQMRRGEFVATHDITSFVHIEDAARAAVLALAWPPGIVNIVDDEPASGEEWAPAFAAAIGAPVPPNAASAAAPRRGVSNEKARRELSWQPIYPSWREGFRSGLGDRESAPSVQWTSGEWSI